MRYDMKRTLLLFVILAAYAVSVAEQTSGLTILFSNQEKVSFSFASKPVIEVTSEGLKVSSSTTEPVSYTFADVLRFYFEDDVTAIGNIETEQSQHPKFSYANNVINVSGLEKGECVLVSTIGGSTTIMSRADEAGSVNIDLSNTPAGVYLVSVGNYVSFKLLKK